MCSGGASPNASRSWCDWIRFPILMDRRSSRRFALAFLNNMKKHEATMLSTRSISPAFESGDGPGKILFRPRDFNVSLCMETSQNIQSKKSIALVNQHFKAADYLPNKPRFIVSKQRHQPVHPTAQVPSFGLSSRRFLEAASKE